MDETDPKDIARGMKELYARRHEFVLEGERREALYRKYSWETQAVKLKEVYRQVLGQERVAV